MAIEELEAAVRASWDRDAIAVYADHLQTIGDPRGELVAIDLRIDEGDANEGVLARRNQLIAEWFGADLPPGIVRYGFVDVDATGAGPDSQLAIALRGPGASYIRSVAFVGPPDQLVRALDMLAAEIRPWLTKITIVQWDEAATPTIGSRHLGVRARDDLLGAIVAATPALDTLAVAGRRVFGELAHPNVRTLQVSGFDALAGLIGAGAPWQRLATLDFAFQCHLAREHADPPDDVFAALLHPSRIPALTTLDLSRNDPGHLDPHTLGGGVDLVSFLERSLPAIETLHIPLPRDPARLPRLRQIVANLAALRELVTYGADDAGVKHPRATVRFVHRPGTPPPAPPPRDAARRRRKG